MPGTRSGGVKAKGRSATGPRGGETTVTPGGLNRIIAYVDSKERQALRQRAFVEDRSVSDLIRTAVRHYLQLDRRR